MITVKNLTRKYGSFTAVNSVSFEIPKGEIIGLLGHNGAGKTTTLKMLTGYLEPTSGQVLIDGVDITEDPLSIQKKIGYLSEQSPLYPDMTTVQYLEYVAQLRGIPENRINSAVRDAIHATDLGPKASAFISTLSKGYRQRVGVAQAIIHKPEILILDEPTNGLDPTQILAMRGLITDIAKTATVILSTHVMQEVEAICDRVIIVLNGRIALDSQMNDLRKANSITLTLKQELEPVRSLFRNHKEITEISAISAENGLNHYHVETSGPIEELAPVVAKKVIENGWDLYRIYGEKRDLETIFREVNKGIGGGTHA